MANSTLDSQAADPSIVTARSYTDGGPIGADGRLYQILRTHLATKLLCTRLRATATATPGIVIIICNPASLQNSARKAPVIDAGDELAYLNDQEAFPHAIQNIQ